ncbi:hypothetical protein QBC34DRAFT_201176 [Podospora aff. communis PSN243]|uniref:F-box domain-containing protein n=1 Tax=Podospora aff. communis PSN243 TaxID=3040156 RepID=A0AAV9G6F5_9PEZI|nr:hypothetical protein QBC34DRAFT_201176 [Podospora aff. communis PSN243]
MPLQLQDLPVELLQLVCSFFCMHCHDVNFHQTQFRLSCGLEKDELETWESHMRQHRLPLVALCQTSKYLRELATPYLYHAVYTFGGYYKLPLDPQRNESLRRFMTTIQSRPELINHVRFIDLPLHDGYRYGMPHIPPNGETMIWFHHLVLSRASAIETMNLGEAGADIAGVMFRTLTAQELRFLTTLQVEGGEEPDTSPDLPSLLQVAPNLRALYLHNFDISTVGPIQPHLLAQVTTLSLGLSVLDKPSILSMIDGCGGLQDFSLDLQDAKTTQAVQSQHTHKDSDLEYIEIHAEIQGILSRLVSHHQTTLRAVSVAINHSDVIGDGKLVTRPVSEFFCRGFSECPNLKAIGLDVPILRRGRPELGTSLSMFPGLLPSSLERLYLEDPLINSRYSASLLLSLERALQSGRLPNLKEVCFPTWAGDLDDKDDTGYKIPDEASEKAVGLVGMIKLWETHNPGFTFLTEHRPYRAYEFF